MVSVVAFMCYEHQRHSFISLFSEYLLNAYDVPGIWHTIDLRKARGTSIAGGIIAIIRASKKVTTEIKPTFLMQS